MKTNQSPAKISNKQNREQKVLFGLIEHYIKTAHPVGSNTLKEMGFEDLSSATIRNYFANLEEEGYLTQPHTSGGRIPTNKAYRLYANESANQSTKASLIKNPFDLLRSNESKEITLFLQQAAELLHPQTQMAVFLSAPHFEEDVIASIKVIVIDHSRCLFVLLTDFGQVLPEVLQIDKRFSLFTAKKIENYFNWRINNQSQQEELTPEERLIAQNLYNELMVRYIVNHQNFNHEDIYKTGLSSLLSHPEFHDPNVLINSLSLFENTNGMRLLLKECTALNTLKFWIGEDLVPYSNENGLETAVVAIPYYVNNQPIGAVGLLGPARSPYKKIFSLLRIFSESISEALTNSLYKFKIEISPTKQKQTNKNISLEIESQAGPLLLENNSHKNNSHRGE